MTSTSSTSDGAPSSSDDLTGMPRELEDELFATWIDADRAAAERALEQLCDQHPEHAEELRRVARRLDYASDECAHAAQADATSIRPESIGPYRVLRELGRGAFGVVWLADQTEPLQRRVAVKVLLPTVRSAGQKVLRRFDTERDTLAQMQHPGIANILDAGTRLSGEPYFVMEYVPGVPVTRYCDDRQLGIDQRLELFLQICAAVQHAHQNGVIHRDLKPGNILVRGDDDPLAKVIDFGLAKALAPGTSEEAGITEEGRFVGTPEYMSPEQASGSPVDTRADIYALGVLLYELLTGELPIDSKILRAGDWSSTLRVLREQEPLRPSEALAKSASGIAEIAARRRTGEDELKRRVRGDLNWIAMTALAKDRERRYANVADLAADVRRHLGNRPVSVGPPSFGYVVGKFARRHRAGVVAAAIIALLLVAGTIVGFFVVAEIVTARHEADRRRADAEANLYAAQIAVANASMNLGRARPMREALRKAPTDLRGWEWRFLAAQSDQSIAAYRTGGRFLKGPALLDAGRTAVVARMGEELVWIEARDLATGEQRFERRGAALEAFHLSSSFDGRIFAVGYTNPCEVHLHDGSTGEPILWMRGGQPVPAILALEGSHATSAFDQQGHLIAAGAADAIRLFDVATGTEVHPDQPMRRKDVSVQDMRFSPDGARLISCSNLGGLTIWDVQSGTHTYLSSGDAGTVRRIDIDAQGKFVASACAVDRSVRVFSLEDGSTVHVLRPPRQIAGVAISPDAATVISAHGDGSITYWDMETGDETGTSAGHVQNIDGVAFAPDGETVVTAAWDGTIRTWGRQPPAVGGHPVCDEVVALAVHPSRPLTFLAKLTPGLRASNPETGEVLWRMDAHVTDLIVADTRDAVISATRENRLVARHVDTGAVLTKVQVPDRIDRLALSTDQRLLAAASRDCRVSVYDARTLELLCDHGRFETTPFVEFTLGDTGVPRLVIASQTMRICDPISGVIQLDAPLSAHAAGLATAPDRRTFVISDGLGRLVQCDAATGREIRIIHDRDPTKEMTTLAFSPDGKRLAVSDNRNIAVRLFDLERSVELLVFYDHGGWCYDLAFGARGERLFAAAGSGESSRLHAWEAPAAAELDSR